MGVGVYEEFFKLVVALTKFQVKNNSLRTDDGAKYNRILNLNIHIARDAIK